jgi:succinyl-CoA synthetase alpha subunit
MSILIKKDTKVIVQGITGKSGDFHTNQCSLYGTKIVSGVTPGKGGQIFKTTNGRSIPIFDTVYEAQIETKANASIIFVPAKFCFESILESVDSNLDLIVCITEGIPTRDMSLIKSKIKYNSKTQLIGPNCPGIITPNECKIGIMPGYIHKKGNVGVVSRSGTLTYEAVWQLTSLGFGQSTCIGIGGDPIIGLNFVDVLKLFNKDPETKYILMIGEIGGEEEEKAADYIKNHVNKPVVAFIAGSSAPSGKRMGHAGAIISGSKGTAKSKKKILKDSGVLIAETPDKIAETLIKGIKNSQKFTK